MGWINLHARKVKTYSTTVTSYPLFNFIRNFYIHITTHTTVGFIRSTLFHRPKLSTLLHSTRHHLCFFLLLLQFACSCCFSAPRLFFCTSVRWSSQICTSSVGSKHRLAIILNLASEGAFPFRASNSSLINWEGGFVIRGSSESIASCGERVSMTYRILGNFRC